ncbi:MAG: hypothetical protein M1824_001299 [Vezdaea acicularis]|nr:MAG: hypothetical protein M1824_001299 [Vezdaea acicularis]
MALLSDKAETEMFHQSLKTQQLLLAYEEACHDLTQTYAAEENRRLRTHILLQEDESDELREQLSDADASLDALELAAEESDEIITGLSTDLQHLQKAFHRQTHELETLRIENHSLTSSSSSSTKLLTEKLALTRELAALKPELEHLRSQTSSNARLLAEKLSLERQLSTLQVELETEKRATARALARGGKAAENDIQLEDEIERLRTELAREKRERARAEKEATAGSGAWESRKAVLEGRVEALKTKLRSTKEALADARAELQKAQAATVARPTTTDNLAPRNPRKRPAAAAIPMDDIAIGTPDGLTAARRGPAAKKRKADAGVGDKSVFSITPFLNRTMSLAPESPVREDRPVESNGLAEAEAEVDAHAPAPAEEQGEIEQATPSAPPESVTRLKPARRAPTLPKATPLTLSNPGTLNAGGLKKRGRPRKVQIHTSSTLDNVVEEKENDEDVSPDTIGASAGATAAVPAIKPPAAVEESSQPAVVAVPNPLEPQQKKKKRKLLGGPIPGAALSKTLFNDDEEAELSKPTAIKDVFARGGRTALGGVQKAGMLGAVGGMGAFGAFSPRKREKRGGAA